LKKGKRKKKKNYQKIKIRRTKGSNFFTRCLASPNLKYSQARYLLSTPTFP
jgi:hypothetical protein